MNVAQPANFGFTVRSMAQAPNRTGGIGKQVSAMAKAKSKGRSRNK